MLGWTTIRLLFCPPPFQPSQCWVNIVGVMKFCSMLEINYVVGIVLGALQGIFFFKSEIRYGSGWVGLGLTRIFFGKSRQNSPKPVLIFWCSIPFVFCL